MFKMMDTLIRHPGLWFNWERYLLLGTCKRGFYLPTQDISVKVPTYDTMDGNKVDDSLGIDEIHDVYEVLEP